MTGWYRQIDEDEQLSDPVPSQPCRPTSPMAPAGSLRKERAPFAKRAMTIRESARCRQRRRLARTPLAFPPPLATPATPEVALTHHRSTAHTYRMRDTESPSSPARGPGWPILVAVPPIIVLSSHPGLPDIPMIDPVPDHDQLAIASQDDDFRSLDRHRPAVPARCATATDRHLVLFIPTLVGRPGNGGVLLWRVGERHTQCRSTPQSSTSAVEMPVAQG